MFLKKLSLREGMTPEQTLHQLPLEKWREQKLLPKERTRALLEHLEERLDPLKKSLTHSLQNWKRPFLQQEIELHTDPSWEAPNVRIQFEVKSQSELKHKLEALSHLNLDTFQRLRSGELNVE